MFSVMLFLKHGEDIMIKKYHNFVGMATGIGMMTLLGIAAMGMATIPAFHRLGLSPLTLAIVLGMVLGNTRPFSISGPVENGIHLVQKRFLRTGIILYGFRITFQEIMGVGPVGFVIDLLVITVTFLVGTYSGVKWFKLDPHTAILTSSGSSICGAAAVIATEGVVQGGSRKTAVAVSTVVLFGTIAMFLYPLMYTFSGLSPDRFGIYIGSTIHEVAQVVVAGESIGSDVAATAVIVKMTRVMLLAPFLILLGIYLSNRLGTYEASGIRNENEIVDPKKKDTSRKKVIIPWFAVGFIAVSGFHSLVSFPSSVSITVNQLDTLLLSSAMAALGTGTNFHRLRGVGIRPFLHGLFLFVFLIVFGYLLSTIFAPMIK